MMNHLPYHLHWFDPSFLLLVESLIIILLSLFHCFPTFLLKGAFGACATLLSLLVPVAEHSQPEHVLNGDVGGAGTAFPQGTSVAVVMVGHLLPASCVCIKL